MTLDNVRHSRARSLQTALLLLLVPACTLVGVEPDEIDLITGETGQEGTEGSSDSASGPGGDGDGDGSSSMTTTGDSSSATDTDDPTDTDPATDSGSDTDTDTGEESGDGDGDFTGNGDGDGDPSTGDGDGDPPGVPCGEVPTLELELGVNQINVLGDSDYTSMCGGEGPDQVYSFTSVGGGSYTLGLFDSFDASLAILNSCDPFEESECVLNTEGSLAFDLTDGETIFILVDAIFPNGGGVGSFVLEQL